MTSISSIGKPVRQPLAREREPGSLEGSRAESIPSTTLELEIGIAIHPADSGSFVWHFVTPNNGDLQTSEALVLPIPTGVVVRFRLRSVPDGTTPSGELFDSTLEIRGDSQPLVGSLFDPSSGETSTVVVTPQQSDVLEVVIYDPLSPEGVYFQEKTPAPLGLYAAQLSIHRDLPRLQSFYLLPGTSVHLTFDTQSMVVFADPPVKFEVEPRPDWLQVLHHIETQTLILHNTGTEPIESAVPIVVQGSGIPSEDSGGVTMRVDPTIVNRGSMTVME